MWRFIHLTDVHIGEPEENEDSKASLSLWVPDILRCLKEDLELLKPDFLLLTGDLTHPKTRDATFAARDLLDSLDVPYFPIGGDSDFGIEKGREWFLEVFHARLPVRDTVYAFTHKGLHFVMLDPWWRWPDGTLCPSLDGLPGKSVWQIPPHQLLWLEEDLTSNSRFPTIIAIHCPVHPPTRRLSFANYWDVCTLQNSDLLLQVLQRHPQVKAIFSGHVHEHYIVKSHGILQIVTNRLTDYPVEYRVVDVFDDRMEISTRGLSRDFLPKNHVLRSRKAQPVEELDRSITLRFL